VCGSSGGIRKAGGNSESVTVNYDAADILQARQALALLKTKIKDRGRGIAPAVSVPSRRYADSNTSTGRERTASMNDAALPNEVPLGEIPLKGSCGLSAYPQIPPGDVEEGGEEEEDTLSPPETCPHCNRSFTRKATFCKHVKICNRVFKQKRKVFDSTANRLGSIVDSSELQRLRKQSNKSNTTQPKKDQKDKIPAWKRESETFRAMIKASRTNDPVELAKCQAALAVMGPDESMVSCPHCGRKFNPESAERHINVCRNVFCKKGVPAKKPGVVSSSRSSITSTTVKAKAKAKSVGPRR